MYSSFIFTEDRLEIKLNALKDEKGIIWFIGKEVAEIFGYKNTRKAIIDHVDEEERIKLKNEEAKKLFESNKTLRTNYINYTKIRELTLINESGFYCLAVKSKLPNAIKYRKWVTKEVLPSLRKNNYYIDKDNINSIQQEKLQKELDSLRKEKDVYIKDSNFYSIRDIKELLGGSMEIDTDRLKEMSCKLGLSIKQEKGYFNSKPICYNRYHFLVWARTYKDVFEITSDEKLKVKNAYDELNNNVCL